MRADKHYKLFNPKGAQDGKPPPCAFFGTAKGCKNGANCKFSHDLPGLKNKTLPATCTRASGNVSPTSSSVGSSVVSSEESESDDNVGGAAPISSRPLAMNEFTPSTSMTTTVGTRDDVSCSSSSVASSEDGGGGNNDDNPFGTKRLKRAVRNAQKKSSSVTTKSPIVKKRRRSTNNQVTHSNNSKAVVEVASPQQPKRNTPMKKKKTKTKRTSDQHNNPTASTAAPATPYFLTLNLPISAAHSSPSQPSSNFLQQPSPSTGNISCSSSSVASSEGNGGGYDDEDKDDMFDTKPFKISTRNSTGNNSPSITTKSPIGKKRRRSVDNQVPLSNSSQDIAAVATSQSPKLNTPKKKTKTKRSSTTPNFHTLDLPITAAHSLPPQPSSTPIPQPPPTTPNFRTLNLPISEFSCYDEATNSNISTIPPETPQSPIPPPPAPKPKPLPIPHSTPEGLRWQKACLATRQHPSYKKMYDPSRMKANTAKYDPNATWVTAKPFGEWCKTNPHAIALDFEMCETKCPSTGQINPKALCRMSVIDASNPDVVLLDTLVKPDWPVKDYRSRINGIRKEHLDDVRFTMEHAQAFVSALCSEETVIIGHAVDNDLAALQMVHHCVVDSACLFRLKGEGTQSCSLKDLSMSVLKREMPATHDSVNDARVTLLCIEEGYMLKKERGEEVEPIERMRTIEDNALKSKLLVHRIPKGWKPQHIEDMFLKHALVKPEEVPEIEFNSTSEMGKVSVKFLTVEHANLAFRALRGKEMEESSGSMQKRIPTKNRGYVNVRKNQVIRNRFRGKKNPPKSNPFCAMQIEGLECADINEKELEEQSTDSSEQELEE